MMMCLVLQRYKFESNSQQVDVAAQLAHGMCLILQRYKFESNSQQIR